MSKILILSFFIVLALCGEYDDLMKNTMDGVSSYRSRSVYGSAQYEVVYNLLGGRVGQIISKPVYLSAENETHTCIYLDLTIPLDNTTYPTKDFGIYNSTSGKYNAIAATINATTGVGGAPIFCAGTISTTGTYVAIYRKTTYLLIAGTATVNDSCGVLGGDNTTCCYNTSCNDRGTCDSDTGICACEDGWSGDFCENSDVTCVNGTFNSTSGFCDCDTGFTGAECSIPTCSSNGYWSASTDLCVCKEGWGGDACDSCKVSPTAFPELVYVCMKTANPSQPFILVALNAERLRNFKGNYISPGGSTTDGTTYDCACNPEPVAAALHSNSHHSKEQTSAHKAHKPKPHHQKASEEESASKPNHQKEEQSNHPAPKPHHKKPKHHQKPHHNKPAEEKSHPRRSEESEPQVQAHPQHKVKGRHQKSSENSFSRLVSNSLTSQLSLPELVDSLLEELGDVTDEGKAIFYGQLVEYIAERELARTPAQVFFAFMLILIGVFATSIVHYMVRNVWGKGTEGIAAKVSPKLF
jgi:hypothetical protein